MTEPTNPAREFADAIGEMWPPFGNDPEKRKALEPLSEAGVIPVGPKVWGMFKEAWRELGLDVDDGEKPK